MFAVIFRATPNIQDDAYTIAVSRMRELAFKKYGCIDFVAVTEGQEEIAISYWNDEASIIAWKKDPEHILSQELGRKKWYKSYSVQITEIKRDYSFPK